MRLVLGLSTGPDDAAGRGIGSTKSQNDQLNGDTHGFVFWRAGLPKRRTNLAKLWAKGPE